jgi:hypothetical protein
LIFSIFAKAFFLPGRTGGSNAAMTQQFTITLTAEEAEQVNKLAAYWRVSLEEALRRAAMDGLDMAMQIKAHNEAVGNPFRPRKTGMSDLDDDIPV